MVLPVGQQLGDDGCWGSFQEMRGYVEQYEGVDCDGNEQAEWTRSPSAKQRINESRECRSDGNHCERGVDQSSGSKEE